MSYFPWILRALAPSVIAAALGGWAASPLWAQCPHCPDLARHTGHAADPSHHAGHGRHAGADAAPRGPHGGTLVTVAPYRVEVVFHQKETRVYLYAASGQPAAVRGVRGQVVMQAAGDERTSAFPLEYKAAPQGAAGQDHLAAAVDLSRARDGTLTATFQLANVPQARDRRLTFAKPVVLSPPPLEVAVVALIQADREGIARQRVCPVMGTRLGEHGTPVKVLIGNQPVYLCCKGCLAKVRANPAAYLPQSATQPAAQPATPPPHHHG